MHHHGFSDSRDVDGLVFDWDGLRRRRDTYVERLNRMYERNLNESGVATVRGTAGLGRRRGRTEDDGGNGGDGGGVVVRVSPPSGGGASDEDAREYTAQHILLATGGRPTLPRGIRVYADTGGADRIEADEDENGNGGGGGTNATTAPGSTTKTVFLRDGRSIGGVDVVVVRHRGMRLSVAPDPLPGR